MASAGLGRQQMQWRQERDDDERGVVPTSLTVVEYLYRVACVYLSTVAYDCFTAVFACTLSLWCARGVLRAGA